MSMNQTWYCDVCGRAEKEGLVVQLTMTLKSVGEKTAERIDLCTSCAGKAGLIHTTKKPRLPRYPMRDFLKGVFGYPQEGKKVQAQSVSQSEMDFANESQGVGGF